MLTAKTIKISVTNFLSIASCAVQKLLNILNHSGECKPTIWYHSIEKLKTLSSTIEKVKSYITEQYCKC